MNVLAKLFGGVTPQAPTQQSMSPAQKANPALNPNVNSPALPGNIPAQNNNPADANNPTAPAASVAATAPEGLDKFSDVWNVKPEDMPQAPVSPFAGVTPEAIAQVAGKTDFSKVVTPEMMTAISAGGEQAAAAMIQALNAVAQTTYAQSAEASIKLIDKALATQREQFQAELPNLIKSQNVHNNLRTSNPIFNHPAAAPILKNFAEQLQLKNPTATSEQIQAQAQEFLLSFAEAATPKTQESQPGSKSQEINWDEWLK